VTAFDERAFDTLRRDADEVSRVRQRAAKLRKGRRPSAGDGLHELLQRVLPGDAEALTRVARVLRFTPDELDGLRRGDVDPAALPGEPLVTLGQLLGFELQRFLSLVVRDHVRFGDRGVHVPPRVAESPVEPDARPPQGGGASERDDWRELRKAWDRASLDMPESH
jgi:hypothetical protein